MTELNNMEKETIAEVGNISLGASATALSIILNKKVEITTPRLQERFLADIRQDYLASSLAVEVSYTEGLEGINVLLIKEEDAAVIAALMMGEEAGSKKGPLNEIELSAVQEAMNQMMGSMATSMSELFDRPIDISAPRLERVNMDEKTVAFAGFADTDLFVQVEFNIRVEEIIDSVMVQVIPAGFAKEMAGQLLQEVSGPAFVAQKLDQGAAEAKEGSFNAIEEAIIAPSEKTEEELGTLEKDALAEVGNISLGSSATALSLLLNRSVEISTPKITVRKVKNIQKEYPVPCLLVEVDYVEGLKGSNVLLLKEKDAAVIAALMMGEELPEDAAGPLDEIGQSAVQEAMNQMMGSMATSMSELFARPINITPPRVELINLTDEKDSLAGMGLEDSVVYVEFSIVVQGAVDSVMAQVIPLDFAREMAGDLLGQPEAIQQPAQVSEKPPQEGPPAVSAAAAERAQAENLSTAAATENVAYYMPSAPPSSFEKVSGSELEKLDLVRDVPMDITVILGTTRLPLGVLFALEQGGIVELDCNATDPVQIVANNRLLARGEIVMVNDQLGVRITEIEFTEVLDQYIF